MCLSVEVNGWLDGKNSHVLVYFYIMRGEYDESLMWPFRGNITVQLLNQVRDYGHHTQVLAITDSADDDFCERVVSGCRSPGGWGYSKYICHSELPNYWKDDCLKLCIKEVELT